MPKLSYFYDEVIVPELFIKNIKIERTCKKLLEDIVIVVEKSEITKNLQNDLKLVVRKKVLVKISNWHGFVMKTTKYNAIQPL